ncbi:hypothetical protein Tco_0826695, partial [Tanacetum coccineum]
MYPFPEEGEELASLMGYPYKCFIRILKAYSQIRMAEDDKEKTGNTGKVEKSKHQDSSDPVFVQSEGGKVP